MAQAAHAPWCALFLTGLPAIVAQIVQKPISVDELPSPGTFPGINASASNAAWPRGSQPSPLDAWPKNASTMSPLACWSVTPLLDTTTGWQGQCLGLTSVGSSKDSVSCEVSCMASAVCSVWQFVNGTGCWQGSGENSGTNCHNRDSGKAAVFAAQRLQHGKIKVLMHMKDVKIVGTTELGVYADALNTSVGISRCRNWCYSNIFCEYWQYGASGCFVDAAGSSAPSSVEYPLTTSGALSYNKSEFARVVWDGEYIQHYCPEPESTLKSLVPEIIRGNLAWFAGGAIAIIAAIVASILCVHKCCGGKAGQKKRAVKLNKASKMDNDEEEDQPDARLRYAQQFQPLNGLTPPSLHPGYHMNQMMPSHNVPTGYGPVGYGGGYNTGQAHGFQYSQAH